MAKCSIASIAVSQNFVLQVENGQYGCNMTVCLNIDDRIRKMCHADVDMTEIFYCLYRICNIYNFLFCTVHLHVDLNVLKLVHEIKHNGYIYSIILTGVDLHPVTSYKLCDCGCLTLDSG